MPSEAAQSIGLSVRTGKGGWDYHAATAASWIVNPLVLPPILMALVLRHYGLPELEIAWTAFVVLMCFGIVPLAYIGWLLRRGEVNSVDVPVRQSRTKPFVVTVLSSLSAAQFVWFTAPGAGQMLSALVVCYALNTAMAMVVNLWWKISVHLLSTAGFVSILTFIAYPPVPVSAPGGFLSDGILVAAGLLIPLLMWARVRLGVHTPGQVTAGAVCGLLVPYIELFALFRTGILPGL